MARSSLFSTYRTGENRVTASMLAVFARMDVSRLESLLAAATGEASLQLVAFENQVKESSNGGVPDGRISGRFALWIETKTSVGAVNAQQLRRHLAHLRAGKDLYERLLVITPDPEEPAAIGQLADGRILWVSFASLVEAIDDVLSDPVEVVSERESVLLRELVQMFEDDGLLATPENTVVVAASTAYREYLDFSAYVCQPGRSFRPGLTHMAFYRSKRIEPEIPAILAIRDNVDITPDNALDLQNGDEVDRAVARLIKELLASDARPQGSLNKVFLLQPRDEAMALPRPLQHQARGAWTQSQRYTSLEALANAATTGDL